MAIRQPVKSLARNSIVYGIGNVANKFVAILLIPVLTRRLSIGDVGFVAIIEMLDLFLVSIFVLGLGNALLRFLPESSIDRQKQLISSIFWGRLIVDVGVSIILIIFKDSLISFLGIPARFQYLFPLIILNSLFTVTGRFYLTLWRYHERPKWFVTLSLVQFVGNLGIAIYFLVILRLGVESVIYSKTIVYGLSTIVTLLAIGIHYSVLPRWSEFRKAGTFGFPMIPLALVAPVLTTSDRFFLNHFVSLEDIGLYSIGYKFGMLINVFLVTPLQMAWIPMMFKLKTSDESKSTIKDLVYYYSFISAGIFVMITAFRTEIIQLFATPQYITGASFIPIITIAYLINGYRHFFIAGSALKNKTVGLGGSAGLSMLVNIVLNFTLIRSFGLWGAAIATLLSYTFLVGSIYVVSQRQLTFQWEWNRIIKLFGWTTILSIPVFYSLDVPSPFNILIKFVVISAFPLGAYFLGLLNERELKGLKSLWLALWQRLGIQPK